MNNRPPNCKAYKRGDQWFCDKCQYVWDISDDEPPECDVAADNSGSLIPIDNAPFNQKQVHRAIGNRALIAIKENLNRE